MKRVIGFIFALIVSVSLCAQAQQDSFSVPEGASDEVRDALQPHPELGDRLLSDQPDEIQEIMRAQLVEQSNRPLPPVPAATKKQLFDQLTAVSGLGMRDLFNFMTSKKKVAEGITFDEVIEAMLIKANEVNFKNVGHNLFWKDASAVTGVPALRVEILQFCDAVVGRRMLDFSPEFSIFIPCRITVMEDATGDIWLMTMDWDVSWLANAWHPDSELSDQLKADAVRIRDSMEAIMQAGANAEW
ncbi:MAG: hypothetical protein DHS20C01_19430 [marine bacterium B5-7]|nr:MAG: hypothetical protein DHS20C01_19430 [marine bacterium B5-7]